MKIATAANIYQNKITITVPKLWFITIPLAYPDDGTNTTINPPVRLPDKEKGK